MKMEQRGWVRRQYDTPKMECNELAQEVILASTFIGNEDNDNSADSIDFSVLP